MMMFERDIRFLSASCSCVVRFDFVLCWVIFFISFFTALINPSSAMSLLGGGVQDDLLRGRGEFFITFRWVVKVFM